MKKIKENWFQMNTWQRMLFIIGMSCSVSVLLLAIFQLCGVLEDAGTIYIPLLGILMVVQTLENWKKNRGVAIFSLCAAIFIFAVVLITLFI